MRKLQLGKLVIIAAALLYWAAAAAAQSSVCAPCHRKIWEKYQSTGMGRSFYPPSPGKMVEDFTNRNTYYHAASNSYFTMLQRGGEYYQRRYQIDSQGRQINVMEKRVDYIMGSGNHSRAYLNRTPANTLVELPLAWYAEKGGYWAMNPGYDRPDHDGFRRPITYDCMFCHNAYPRVPAKPEQPVYEGSLPQGIDCQRCHGPGTAHVRLASTAGAARPDIRNAIVNPSRLGTERQMELCMSCHLETTSFPLPNALTRYGRGVFSYQPGEPLEAYLLNFDHAPGTGREDKFEIVNAAYRLRRSACFVKSGGKMLCTTCHDPHDAPRGEAAQARYDSACRQCHSSEFQQRVAAGQHTNASDCTGCHMPKRRTEDVVHVAMTDHYIQRRKPVEDLLADRLERHETGAAAYRGRVIPYYPEKLSPTPENELLVAVAQVKQGSNPTEGIAQLTAALEKYKPARGEYYRDLAEALQSSGQLTRAVPFYRAAVLRNPQSAAELRALGTALRRSGQTAEAVGVLQRAVVISPEEALTWHELALAYRALGKNSDAIAALGNALNSDPEMPEAHNNLGILLASSGDQENRAESAFREAIRIRPHYADAHGNLANLLGRTGNLREAKEHFVTALQLRPTDAATHYNYAMLLGRTGDYDKAQSELESSLRNDPHFTDAHLLLGNLLLAKGHAPEAIPHYREALRNQPDSARAHFSLGSALASVGDVTGALPHLRTAASGTEPEIREQAATLLRRLAKSP